MISIRGRRGSCERCKPGEQPVIVIEFLLDKELLNMQLCLKHAAEGLKKFIDADIEHAEASIPF